MYARLLADLDESDFTSAVEDIILNDEWFPAVARIREVAATFSAKRARSVTVVVGSSPTLVCPTCAGAHWVRQGGYDALNQPAGEDGSRTQPCPNCTTNGRYDREKERFYLLHQPGVLDPNGGYVPDVESSTWRLPRYEDGSPDLDELYRQSRILRDMDPNIDERPTAPAGWKTLGKVFA